MEAEQVRARELELEQEFSLRLERAVQERVRADAASRTGNISRKEKKKRLSPIAQMADIGFKVVLLERLNQKWKQNHLQNPCNESKNQGGDHV